MKLISPVDRVSAKEVVLNPAECDVSVSKLFHFLDGFRFGIKEVSDSVFQQFGIGKSIRFIIKKNWYRKKFWIRARLDFGGFGS